MCRGGICVPATDYELFVGTVSDFVVDKDFLFFIDTGSGTVNRVTQSD